MQFNSTLFIFCFLPLFLAIYYLLPTSKRPWLLAIGSLVFYAQTGSKPILTLPLLICTTVFSYLIARGLRKPGRAGLLGFGLTVLAAELVFFKCFRGGQYLPTGMSFYLFLMAAYLIDVYRQRLRPERRLIRYTAQMVMFPKLLMGPLADPAQLQAQFRRPGCSYAKLHRGLQEFIAGLCLKVILADRIGGLWAQAGVISYESISTPFAWLALICFAMRLYFDFWSYSIMAIGLGHMLGFDLPENFLDPYASRSVSEFWRRWHVTLGVWFRNYLYIPLGGNRKGTLRTVLNLLVVWIFTGLWHGVGGNYLLWAMFLFFFIVLERLFLCRVLERIPLLGHVYTILVILLSWVPFAIGNWPQLQAFTLKLFGMGGQTLNSQDFLIWGREYVWLLLAGVVFVTPLPRLLWNKIRRYAITDVLLFILFWVAVYCIATSAQNPFLYFQY